MKLLKMDMPPDGRMEKIMKLEKKDVIYERSTRTAYREGDDIVKIFTTKNPKWDAFQQAANHAYAEAAGISVPVLKSVQEFDGQWGVVESYVEGPTLAQLLEEKPKQYKKFIDQLIDIQLEVMNHKAPNLKNTIDKLTDRINSMTGILDATTRYELLERLHGMSRHTKVCHGKLIPSNVIITKKGYYVVDWGHATKGNAGADAAVTYLYFAMDNEKYADYYIKQYCLKSDTPLQYIQKWMPIVAALELSRHPEKSEFLMKWITVAEYV